MIGLLKKDLFVADKSGRLLLVLALVFSAVPSMSAFGNTYAMMLAAMMPMNSIAYDERCKWDRYAAMLPYRVSQLVWSKYLLAYLYTLLGSGIMVLGTLLRSVTGGTADWLETAQTCVMLALVMLFITALGLPVLYRFGSEKGRLAMILCMGASVGAAMGLLGIFGELPEFPELPLPVVMVGVAVLAVVVTGVSVRLSVHFYRKRQNGAYD